ncbi:HIG1 domain-containing protein [Novosphingobium taihuense]|uniref:Putative FlgJ-related protein n=1 Tax=Novosphingobium taihuense TaxID=260085 RepID=A0A7W7ETA7_9SPHN|nr:HIG1 domain-containing protein [Novosphingobium taihuense]MBB4612814.1 putative FlgJ-related protein [Novosphingobium taihuense]TWH80276.1 hypoxia induced protein [Novosphingobium taihuense]
MNYVLITLIIVFTVMTVVSLVRGIIAFLNSTKEDLNRDPAQGATANQLLQNKMMFNRIKFQGLAVLTVAILLAFSR